MRQPGLYTELDEARSVPAVVATEEAIEVFNQLLESMDGLLQPGPIALQQSDSMQGAFRVATETALQAKYKLWGIKETFQGSRNQVIASPIPLGDNCDVGEDGDGIS